MLHYAFGAHPAAIYLTLYRPILFIATGGCRACKRSKSGIYRNCSKRQTMNFLLLNLPPVLTLSRIQIHICSSYYIKDPSKPSAYMWSLLQTHRGVFSWKQNRLGVFSWKQKDQSKYFHETKVFFLKAERPIEVFHFSWKQKRTNPNFIAACELISTRVILYYAGGKELINTLCHPQIQICSS